MQFVFSQALQAAVFFRAYGKLDFGIFLLFENVSTDKLKEKTNNW